MYVNLKKLVEKLFLKFQLVTGLKDFKSCLPIVINRTLSGMKLSIFAQRLQGIFFSLHFTFMNNLYPSSGRHFNG
jgi:hypothetical protein